MLGIIMPAYKRTDCLREALNSLVMQTRKDFILVIVDDHSPEPLLPVVQEYENVLQYMYYYAEQNGGPAQARQIGLEICYENNFEYVTFLDSDDMLMPHAVERLLHEIENNKCDFISSTIWQELGEGKGGKISNDNETWLHGKIYRTSYLRESGIVFPPIKTNEDMVFNLTAMECSKNKGFLDEVLYLFRHNPNSLTRSEDASLGVVSVDYIAALYYVSKYMMENLGDITSQVLVDIFAVYNFYQNGLKNGLVTEEIKEYVRYMLNIPSFKKAINDPETFEKFVSIPNQVFVYKGKIYYYQQTFEEWLKEFEIL